MQLWLLSPLCGAEKKKAQQALGVSCCSWVGLLCPTFLHLSALCLRKRYHRIFSSHPSPPFSPHSVPTSVLLSRQSCEHFHVNAASCIVASHGITCWVQLFVQVQTSLSTRVTFFTVIPSWLPCQGEFSCCTFC